MANVTIKPSMQDYLNYPNILYEGTTIVSGSGSGIVLRSATILSLAKGAGNFTQEGKDDLI